MNHDKVGLIFADLIVMLLMQQTEFFKVLMNEVANA